jgi:hypothetical protein
MALPRGPRFLTVAACAVMCLFAPVSGAAERPIPAAVNIRAFAVEQGDGLDVLVRMPLGAVKNVQFPIRGDEYLDLAQLRTMLPGIAEHWIARSFEVSNHATVLARPAVMGTRLSISSDASFNSFAGATARFTAADLPP